MTSFDSMYRDATPPWDIGRPQGAFVPLAEAGALRGSVLDVGCGTGEHALLAAGLGLSATGVDSAPTAIARAEDKARARGLDARFVVGDALTLDGVGGPFDTVLDCGLFHVFDDAERTRFAAALHAVTAVGGRYFLLCFSDRQPGDWGPRRVTQGEIRACFADGWRVDEIVPAVIEVLPFNDHGEEWAVESWLATITRR
ncbi:class I SAM-dependent methyltransferase [Solihabitans fulvus]|uniref:Class I SAM-dependent methyltransferase n=1 Tax=Solihabitans fulvus TaxID=1892852 RepID=A0A5B2XA52_9PSEU|nr:class I SAM-dependent methyltransferase [Solihabitans fulvus]KAA2260457.1 class I SAM-dependent methyltransferase [Solihabitans fulvus]